MRKAWTGVFLGVALLAACAQQPWFAFKPADGSFHASFPFEPTKSIRTVESPAGRTDVTSYTATERQLAYSVTVADYPKEHITEVGVPKFLDEVRDVAVANARGKLLSEKSDDFKGHTGRDIKLAVPGGKDAFRCKLILVDSRLYQLIVAGPTDDVDGSSAERFFGAFTLP